MILIGAESLTTLNRETLDGIKNKNPFIHNRDEG
jgi:hypothetical protein